MTDSATMIQRAFQLAREGTVRSVADIRRTLKTEQYDNIDAYISGSLAKQLNAEITKRLSILRE